MTNNYLQSPHIGELLKKYTADKRIYRSAWARHQSVKDSTILRYFKKPSIQISTLFTISQVLKYNFIRTVADALPPDYPPFAPNPLQAEIDALKKENEDLKKEIAILRGLMKGN
jgi:hypothetical protein